MLTVILLCTVGALSFHFLLVRPLLRRWGLL